MTTYEKFKALEAKEDTLILGIESSCDETAASVVRGGRLMLSNVIASQIDIHQRFGGVVPEVASRNHTLALPNVIDRALKDAGVTASMLSAVAVTYGAGLVGALLVGVSSAKAYAYAINRPLIKVNHIQAHIAANYLEHKDLTPPFVALVASGGHTAILDVSSYNDYTVLGSTMDDAIGEAFDKVARLLGLPYPGGVHVDRLSKQGNANISFYKNHKGVRPDLSLSYSGLKTAVVNYIHNLKQKNQEIPVADICASFTKNAVDLLVDTTMAAVEKCGKKTIVLAGGVAANSYLRQNLAFKGHSLGCKVLFPSPILCTDNAAMVAARAHYAAFYAKDYADLNLNACSFLPL